MEEVRHAPFCMFLRRRVMLEFDDQRQRQLSREIACNFQYEPELQVQDYKLQGQDP